ncbi:hypothetical protein DERP_003182 [Dermatophagoides pteronyssinus]|uniref:Uncharacterized protein n=1 Tax=Dermatophagoides pteronyssinus TaxID=6956 RepID=A0ABQ8JIR8_DERPT|nr:hypothetical protein DERP_003182 [Dermatophagoides pteronyssinus]
MKIKVHQQFIRCKLTPTIYGATTPIANAKILAIPNTVPAKFGAYSDIIVHSPALKNPYNIIAIINITITGSGFEPNAGINPKHIAGPNNAID